MVITNMEHPYSAQSEGLLGNILYYLLLSKGKKKQGTKRKYVLTHLGKMAFQFPYSTSESSVRLQPSFNRKELQFSGYVFQGSQ